MELVEIIAAGAGGIALLLGLLALVARRGRATARAKARGLERDLADTSAAAATARAGEREAVWALGATRERLAAMAIDHDVALARLEGLERDLDDLRDRLITADRDLATARRDADEARTELARLEAETTPPAGTDAEETFGPEPARAVFEPMHDVDGGHDDARARLVASEARRRDLDDRLASLGAVRAAEQRTAAERIAGLERLHLQIGEREERIADLETELKQAEESRDEALADVSRLQVELVRLKGELADAKRRLVVLEEHSGALAEARRRITELEGRLGSAATTDAEVERLRKGLEAERARAERISRRATETASDTTYAMWDRVVRERVDLAIARETARLEERVAHLSAVVAEKEARIRALTGTSGPPVATEPPPITAIKGIGPKIAAILAQHGVTTIADVAALTDEDIDRLGDHMPVYPGRIRDDDWVGQARSFL